LADRVTLDCEGLVSKINPGYSKTCSLKEEGQAHVYIAEEDLHNGSAGTYSFEQTK
jgi:hypothetical protein